MLPDLVGLPDLELKLVAPETGRALVDQHPPVAHRPSPVARRSPRGSLSHAIFLQTQCRFLVSRKITPRALLARTFFQSSRKPFVFGHTVEHSGLFSQGFKLIITYRGNSRYVPDFTPCRSSSTILTMLLRRTLTSSGAYLAGAMTKLRVSGFALAHIKEQEKKDQKLSGAALNIQSFKEDSSLQVLHWRKGIDTAINQDH